MTVVEQKKTENYSSPELLSIRATFCTRQMLLWEKKRLDSKGSRAFLFFLFFLHSTHYVSSFQTNHVLEIEPEEDCWAWISLCFPSPPLFLQPFFQFLPPSFSLPHIVLPLYLSPIFNSLLHHPYLCLPLILSFSLLSLYSSRSISLFSSLLAFQFLVSVFHC